MAERRRSRPRKTPARKRKAKSSPNRWSQRVTRESDALDLQHGVFTQTSAKKIAASLKRSAERSSRRKTNAYRSALSMLTFYINRAGKNLPATQRSRLERAKTELKRQFGRNERDRHCAGHSRARIRRANSDKPEFGRRIPA